MAQSTMPSIQYKDMKLAYQPFFDTVRKFETTCRAKNISKPFSEAGFESVMATEGLVNRLIDEFGASFRGDESLAAAYKSCVNHAIQEHSNPFAQYMDSQGNVQNNNLGSEGYGATAITGNYNAWTRLNPVITAGYLARSRSLELFQVINDDKPTFWREYNVQYIQKGLGGEKLILPKAIRAGKVTGLLDLPLCEQIVDPAAAATSQIVNIGPVAGEGEGENKVTIGITGAPFVKGMLKTGSVGNLFDGSKFAKERNALERAAAIDYIHVKFPKTDATNYDAVIKVHLERDLKTGISSERLFSDVLNISYIDSDGFTKIKKIPIMAVINLDTGDYRIMDDGTGYLQHIRFKIRVTNVANEMESLMNGQDKYTLTFDVENKTYGSIPIIPEMNQDFNAGGEGVSWVAYMTDQMTENFAGIADNDREAFIDEWYGYDAREMELAFKLGGYKFNGTFPVAQRHPGGSDDLLAPVRSNVKHYLTRIFARAEKTTNFDKNIERQWIIMANDEDAELLPDIQWQNASAELSGNEGTSSFRYGFSLDDAYGFIDSFSRRVRVIGSKDERWLGKPLTCVLKTTTIAAPTLIYFPYMFRVFSGISPDLDHRPALLFASRDAKRCSTLVQARITFDGNDETIYTQATAFAAGFPRSGQPNA